MYFEATLVVSTGLAIFPPKGGLNITWANLREVAFWGDGRGNVGSRVKWKQGKPEIRCPWTPLTLSREARS